MVRKNFTHAWRYGHQCRRRNNGLEGVYHIALNSVKELYSQLPDQSDRTVCEINRKKDRSSVFGMHTFITKHFYFHLECDHWDKYWVYYNLGDSPFKTEIKALIKKLIPEDELKLQQIDDWNQFYSDVLKAQTPHNILILPFKSKL